MSGIERNPEPSSSAKSSSRIINSVPGVKFGCLKVRSCRSKAALLYNIIADNSLDVLALQETWLRPDDPPTITCDVAPDGYSVFHVFRESHNRMVHLVVEVWQ